MNIFFIRFSTLFIALISTFFYININLTEFREDNINRYSLKDAINNDRKRAKTKLYLMIIASLFWSGVIMFF